MINVKSNSKYNIGRKRSLFDPNQLLGCVLLGIVSGAAGGVVMGIISRFSMRAVALLAGQEPGFSVDGTLFIIGIGAVFGALLGLVYAFILPFMPGSISQKGLILGGVVSLLITLVVLVVQAEGELALVSKGALIALFAPLPLLYGLVLGRVATWLVPAESQIVAESADFAHTAALITIAAAAVGTIIEMMLIITHPTITNLGYDRAIFLDNAAGGMLLLMAIVGTAGLLRSGATGTSIATKIGLGISLFVFSLLGLGTIGEGMRMVKLHGLVRLMDRLEYDESLIVPLILFLAALSGLLLAGIAVLRGRRWQGWHRYSPLSVGLIPFLSLPILHPSFFPALVGISNLGRVLLTHVIGMLFALCWLALGIALRTEAGPSQRDTNEVI